MINIDGGLKIQSGECGACLLIGVIIESAREFNNTKHGGERGLKWEEDEHCHVLVVMTS
jgi:hypothetical protein